MWESTDFGSVDEAHLFCARQGLSPTLIGEEGDFRSFSFKSEDGGTTIVAEHRASPGKVKYREVAPPTFEESRDRYFVGPWCPSDWPTLEDAEANYTGMATRVTRGEVLIIEFDGDVYEYLDIPRPEGSTVRVRVLRRK